MPEADRRDPQGENRPTGGGRSAQGPNHDPGGDTEMGGLVPPYDGRTEGPAETETSEARREGIERQLAETDTGRPGATASPANESPVREEEVAHGSAGAGEQSATDTKATSAMGVGQSTTRRGENISDDDGKEAGRTDEGTQGKSERPVGSSSPRDVSGVNPG